MLACRLTHTSPKTHLHFDSRNRRDVLALNILLSQRDTTIMDSHKLQEDGTGIVLGPSVNTCRADTQPGDEAEIPQSSSKYAEGSFLKKLFDPVMIDGEVNPAQLAFGARGYHIQTKTLHIPERFGFFSSGPPRLQARQGFCLIFILLLCVSFYALCFVLLFMLWVQGRPVKFEGLGGAGMIGAAPLVCFPLGWISSCLDPARSPDYEWPDDLEHGRRLPQRDPDDIWREEAGDICCQVCCTFCLSALFDPAVDCRCH